MMYPVIFTIKSTKGMLITPWFKLVRLNCCHYVAQEHEQEFRKYFLSDCRDKAIMLTIKFVFPPEQAPSVF